MDQADEVDDGNYKNKVAGGTKNDSNCTEAIPVSNQDNKSVQAAKVLKPEDRSSKSKHVEPRDVTASDTSGHGTSNSRAKRVPKWGSGKVVNKGYESNNYKKLLQVKHRDNNGMYHIIYISKLLANQTLLVDVYRKMKSNPGNMSAETEGKTLDGIG